MPGDAMMLQQVMLHFFSHRLTPQPGVKPLQLIPSPSKIRAIVAVQVLWAASSAHKSGYASLQGVSFLVRQHLQMYCLVRKAHKYTNVGLNDGWLSHIAQFEVKRTSQIHASV